MKLSNRIFTIKLFCAIVFTILIGACEGPNIIKPVVTQRPSQTTDFAKPNAVTTAPTPAPIVSVQPTPVIKKKTKIAALLPLSGKNKDLGTAMLNSIILSLFDNDQQNIELVMFDSADLKKAANEITSQKIKIVIGPIFSTDVEEFASMVKGQNVTILSFSNNQDLSGKKGVFLMGFLPEQQIERITAYSISQGKDNFAILAPSNQYGQKFVDILQQMVRRKDGNMVASELYLNSTKDLERAVSKVVNSFNISPDSPTKNKKNLKEEDKFYANVIMIPESGAVLSKIVAMINRYNINEREIQIIGSSNWDDSSTLNDPNLIGGWFTSTEPARYKQFERSYSQIYSKVPPRISSVAYDAALAAIEVVRKSEKKDITTDDFINYKSVKNGFVGIDGLFRFLPNGIVQRNFAVLEVRNGNFQVIDGSSSMFFKY